VLKRCHAERKKTDIFTKRGPNACNYFTEAVQNVFVEFGIDSSLSLCTILWESKKYDNENNQHGFNFGFFNPFDEN